MRPKSERTKERKDLLQAACLADYHARSGEADAFNAAWRDAVGRGRGWKSRASLPRPTLAPHAVTVNLDGVPVRTLDLHGLLKTKQLGREKDAADRAVLERAIRLLGP